MDARHLQALYANLPVGVVVLDDDGLVRELNRRAEELLGLRAGEDVLGDCDRARWSLLRPDGDPLPPQDDPITRVLAGEPVVRNVDVGIDWGDGEVLWARVTVAALLPPDGGGAVAVYEDVTERHLADERRRRWQELLETTREHLAMACDAAELTLWRYDHGTRATQIVRGGGIHVGLGLDVSNGTFRPEDLVDRMLPESRDAFVHATTRARRSGTPYEVTYGVTRPSGGTAWLLERGQPDPDDPDVVLGATLDITEQVEQDRRRRVAEDRLAKVLATAPDVISLALPDGELQYVSPAVEDLLGHAPEALVGRQQPGLVAAGALQVVPDEPVHERRRVEHVDGSTIWVDTVTAAVLGKDGAHELVSVTRDVTEEVQAFAEVDRLRSDAEKATRTKSAFLANMSHEIRTPMNAIIGMSRLALESDLTPRQRRYLERVEQSADSLMVIINDLLDYSKIEAGRLELEDVAFRLDDVIDAFRTSIGLHAVGGGVELLFDIDADVPLGLRGDPLRLGQVLINLGSNAVKFTDAGGEVVLDVHVARRGAGRAELCFMVRDSGIGMSEEQLDRLFEPFTQADVSTTRAYGGTGLGLAIAHDLVEGMGGSIEVDSSPGDGTTFRVTIPFVLTGDDTVVETEADLGPRTPRILVVDDRPTAREVHVRMVERMGLRVDQARDGAEALAVVTAASEDPYDLLLVDWRMPGMDGIELVRRLDDGTTGAPSAVVMVTAYDRVEAQDAARGVAISEFIEKPATPSMLHDAIMTALGREVVRHRHKGPRPAVQALAEPLREAHVLLVEDHRVNQELAVELLERGGLRVTVARDGEQALEALDGTRFDAVLMDCQMPVMDGYEATRRLRARRELADLPVIAMTANARDVDRDKVLAAGMDDHIAKPIDVRDMWETLARWIGPDAMARGDVADVPADERRRALRVLPGGRAEEPAADPAVPLLALEGVDVEEGLRVCGGNTSLYLRLLTGLAEHHGDVHDRIAGALAASDLEAAGNLAHAVRGVAANVRARSVAAGAAAVEEACDRGDAEAATTALVEFARRHTTLVAAVRAIGRGDEPTSRGAAADHEALLDRLASLLDRADPEAARLVEDLGAALGSRVDVRRHVRALQDAVRAYDFDAGRSQLERLREELQLRDSG